MTTATGRQGFGFWDTTHYPIGGCFRRFGQGETITDIVKMDGTCHGATHMGKMVRDGKAMTIAFGIRALEPASTPVRDHQCSCGHEWTAEVVHSGNTQNTSGEPTPWCPKCNKRAAISSPVR